MAELIYLPALKITAVLPDKNIFYDDNKVKSVGGHILNLNAKYGGFLDIWEVLDESLGKLVIYKKEDNSHIHLFHQSGLSKSKELVVRGNLEATLLATLKQGSLLKRKLKTYQIKVQHDPQVYVEDEFEFLDDNTFGDLGSFVALKNHKVGLVRSFFTNPTPGNYLRYYLEKDSKAIKWLDERKF